MGHILLDNPIQPQQQLQKFGTAVELCWNSTVCMVGRRKCGDRGQRVTEEERRSGYLHEKNWSIVVMIMFSLVMVVL